MIIQFWFYSNFCEIEKKINYYWKVVKKIIDLYIDILWIKKRFIFGESKIFRNLYSKAVRIIYYYIAIYLVKKNKQNFYFIGVFMIYIYILFWIFIDILENIIIFRIKDLLVFCDEFLYFEFIREIITIS